MHILKNLIVALFFVCGVAVIAKADTDYRCLNACVNSGKPSAACLMKCTYGDSQPSSSSSNTNTLHGLNQESSKFSHKEFVAPIPLANGTVLPTRKASGASPEKDYTCIAECQQEGLQYQFCEEKCVKKDQGIDKNAGKVQGIDEYLK